MKRYVEHVSGWIEAVEVAFFDLRFQPDGGRIVVVDGTDIGVLTVDGLRSTRDRTHAYLSVVADG